MDTKIRSGSVPALEDRAVIAPVSSGAYSGGTPPDNNRYKAMDGSDLKPTGSGLLGLGLLALVGGFILLRPTRRKKRTSKKR